MSQEERRARGKLMPHYTRLTKEGLQNHISYRVYVGMVKSMLARFSAGKGEPFTVHATASRDAPRPASHVTLSCMQKERE